MTKKEMIKVASVAAKYIVLVGIVFVLSFAEIDTSITPFAVSFLFASIYLPVNFWVSASAVFCAKLFITTEHLQVVSTLFAVGVFVVFCLLTLRFKRLRDLAFVVTAFVASNLCMVVNASVAEQDFYRSLVSVIVGGVFLVCVVILVQTAKKKRAKIPWTIDQKICAAVFTTVFALGLAGIEIQHFSVHKFVSIYIILVGVYLFNAKSTLVVAICLGLGQSLVSLNLNYVAVYALLCAAAMAFKSRNPTFSIVALVFTDIVLGTYFDAYISYGFWSMLPVFAAVVGFIIMPPSVMKQFDFSVNLLTGNLVSKNTINRNRAGVHARLQSLASVFGEMQNIYRALIQPVIPVEHAKVLIASQVQSAVCDNCKNKANCNQSNKAADVLREAFQSIAYVGLKRGVVNFLDIPHDMTIRCSRVNSVLSMTNTCIKKESDRKMNAERLDTGKVLMAQLLAGLNKLMLSFAEDVCSDVVFDHDKADLIKEELLFHNIVASDCLITKTSKHVYTVSVLVSRVDAESSAIEQVISRVVRHKMQRESIDDSTTAGFSIVIVKTAPRFAAVFGVAQITKNWGEQSGDIYSFLKINHERTLMAICDGMGTGEDAGSAAMLALSLVENFYKAGFPNEIIMTSVNQLLQITGQEVFSALDMAVVNLSSGEIEFIKVGASDGFIKRNREVEVVEAGSLPIGVLEEMQPKITRAVLNDGDMVIIASDGVLDSFGERIHLANFINNLNITDAQEIADVVMQECLNRSGRIAKDDCTIAVCKLTQR